MNIHEGKSRTSQSLVGPRNITPAHLMARCANAQRFFLACIKIGTIVQYVA